MSKKWVNLPYILGIKYWLPLLTVYKSLLGQFCLVHPTARGIESCTMFDISFLQIGWMLANANLTQVRLAIGLYCIKILCTSDKKFKKYWQHFDRGQKRLPRSAAIFKAERRKRLKKSVFFCLFSQDWLKRVLRGFKWPRN